MILSQWPTHCHGVDTNCFLSISKFTTNHVTRSGESCVECNYKIHFPENGETLTNEY